MPPSNPPLRDQSDARESAGSQTHRADEQLRSSFVAMVNDVLGCERTSSFTEKNGDLNFALGVSENAAPPIGDWPDSVGGRFTVKRALGRGGFGTVYLAHDESLDRDVALKVPHEKLRSDPLLSSLCLKEARLAAKLRHPSIVTIFDIHDDGGRIGYIVQEYVQGATLQQLMSDKRLSIRQTLHIILKVAEAIQFAHSRGVYHRDLKPANLIVDEVGGIRVLDFGLAVDEEMQRTSRGQVAGTIAYMSPEQVLGKTHHLDGRTDIWSLGVIFYELLAGRRPFRGTQDEIADQVVRREVAPPRQFLASIPKRVELCCLKCLAKSVSERYGTALDLLEELQVIIATELLPDELPSGPVTTSHQQDTKKSVSESSRNSSDTFVVRKSYVWWIVGVIAAVLGTWLFVQATLAFIDGFSPRPLAMPNPAFAIPPGGPDPTKPVKRFEREFFDSAWSDLLVSPNAKSTAQFDNQKVLTIQDRAILFGGSVEHVNYEVKVSLKQEGDWKGSIGVLLGVTRSATNPNVSIGYFVKLAEDKRGHWTMEFQHLTIESNEIVATTNIGRTVILHSVPSGSNLLEIKVQNGYLFSVTFERQGYGDIATSEPEKDETIIDIGKRHGVTSTLLNGQVGLMSNDAPFIVNRVLLVYW